MSVSDVTVKRVVLPDNRQRRLVFYLAMEEYVARHKELGDAAFFWKVPPTVIFGRNQDMASEVNITWCRENGVQTYRRKSGGGCVYADEGNLMISYVSADMEVDKVFSRYLHLLSEALRGLGVDAVVSGRNDVLVGGMKVSGNAFQLLKDCSIVHGTLLYDADFDALSRAITPSESKIRSKGVSSVRQHVTNLRPLLQHWCCVHDIESLSEYLAQAFCDGTVVLDEAAMEEISEIEKTYLDPAFIAGHRFADTIERRMRIDSVGEVCVEITASGRRITDAHLSGDYFTAKTPESVDEALSAALRGMSLDEISGISDVGGIGAAGGIGGIGDAGLAAIIKSIL